MTDNELNGGPTLGALARESFYRLFADEAIPLAGNIAFRTLFSIFPFLIFLTALAGFFGNDDLAASVVSYLLSVAPHQLVQAVEPEIRSILTVPRTGLLSLSALITIWSAMGGVDSVRVGLNRAYDLRDTRPFWWTYLQNVLFVIGAAVFLLEGGPHEADGVGIAADAVDKPGLRPRRLGCCGCAGFSLPPCRRAC